MNEVETSPDVFSQDADVMSGALVFRGTRIPAQTFFDHLDHGGTVDQFLEWFLSCRFNMSIVDKTEKRGKYDFAVKWDVKDRSHSNDDALKQYLLDRLGLELVPDAEPIPTLVIAKAD